jgi:hypothetical protein
MTAPVSERLIVVLGTNHRLQGVFEREGNIDDPAYAALLEHLIAAFSVDYLFEEATELGPTTAQQLAKKRRGLTYLDIDPHPSNRARFGLERDTGHPYDASRQPWNPKLPERGEVCEEYVEPQIGRELYWVKTIKATSFRNALVVCGFLHTLSLAGRFHEAGIERVKALAYMPYKKLTAPRK